MNLNSARVRVDSVTRMRTAFWREEDGTEIRPLRVQGFRNGELQVVAGQNVPVGKRVELQLQEESGVPGEVRSIFVNGKVVARRPYNDANGRGRYWARVRLI